MNTPTRLLALLLISFAAGRLSLYAQAPVIPPPPPPDLSSTPAPDNGPAAMITFASGNVAKAQSSQGELRRIGLAPSQNIAIRLQYGDGFAGQPVSLQSLDGGKIVAPTEQAAVTSDGTTDLTLGSPAETGQYRFLVQCGGVATTITLVVLSAGDSPDPSLLIDAQ